MKRLGTRVARAIRDWWVMDSPPGGELEPWPPDPRADDRRVLRNVLTIILASAALWCAVILVARMSF